ncbi:MAG: 16S rRNA (cytosine(967)-C(5))-methyltransferase RsmB [Pseudomonadota bacterium]
MPISKASISASPRLVASYIIAQLLQQQGSLASLLPLYTVELSSQDSRLVRELCFGCCRWYPQLSTVLTQLVSKPLKTKDADIEATLLLGFYQLAFMRTPAHAAINESVSLASALHKAWAKKLINAVLRRFQREQGPLLDQAKQSLPHAHPVWLAKKISQAWPEHCDSIFEQNNQHPPFTLRVNRQCLSRDQYLEQLEKKNIQARSALHSADGIYLEQAQAVTSLPLFAEGGISVQDEAAQLAAYLLKLKPNLRVLDACCAPGGKTAHIAEHQTDLAKLFAVDIEPRRLIKVEENLTRLHINAEICHGDATCPEQWWDGEPFDRILVDAPCSATGIIRRQPDIKLLRDAEQVKTLCRLQTKMVQALWPLLKEGGILVYASCSILPEENTRIMEAFLAKHDDAKEDKIDACWGIAQTIGRQLLPQNNGHDGFYYARILKV